MALAFSTAKLTEHPLFHNSYSLNLFFSSSKPSFLYLKPSFSSITTSSVRTTEHSNNSKTRKNYKESSKRSVHSAPWINKWTPMTSKVDTMKKNPNLVKNKRKEEEEEGEEEVVEHKYFDGNKGNNSIERIVHRLRNLGVGSDDDEVEEEEVLEGNEDGVGNVGFNGEEKLGDLLQRNWGRPDTIIDDEEVDESMLLPWERGESRVVGEEGEKFKDKRVRAPTLAELTIEDVELRRLRTQGMTLRERISIPKAGVTTVIVEKIHEKWRKAELVRLKFHETLAHDMRTAHEIVERRTGGLVIWRSGSVMVVFRGTNYERPSSRPQSVDSKADTLFVPDIPSADDPQNGNDISSVGLKIQTTRLWLRS